MKKVILIIGVVTLLASSWFLFVKPADYKAMLKTTVTVGAVNQTLKMWNYSFSAHFPIEQKSLSELVQTLKFGDSLHRYSYTIERLTDSLTQLTIRVKDIDHSLNARLKGLISHTDFEKRSETTVRELYEVIKQHEENHKISIKGITTLPAKEYAYTELKGVQRSKAFGMMKDISLLQTAMARYNVPLDGTPFVEITKWNQDNDSIYYNFCFPIKRTEADSLPQWKEIKYGVRKKQKALKATYNGNYITSDRAWYALLNYAKTNSITVEPKPYEEFFNNPNMGGDALQWQADVYLPIKE